LTVRRGHDGPSSFFADRNFPWVDDHLYSPEREF